MKAGKNDESNSTTVYIENSLEINRDVRKIRKIVNLQAPSVVTIFKIGSYEGCYRKNVT